MSATRAIFMARLPQKYSKTPLIRIPGDQFNMFELGGFRIRGD